MKKYYLLIIVILLIPIFLHSLRFNNLTIGNPDDWSSFGNYYGGVLSPIITAITTLLLINITLKISKNEIARQDIKVISDTRTNVINKLVTYQQKLNSIKSQFAVNEILIDAKFKKINYEYNNMDFFKRGEENSTKTKQNEENELHDSIKFFYADIFYMVSEIKTYFDNFEKNEEFLFSSMYLSKKDYNELLLELLGLEKFIVVCLKKSNLSIPNNIEKIENELAKFISVISKRSFRKM